MSDTPKDTLKVMMIDYAVAHLAEIGMGVLACVLVVILVDFIKPAVVALLRRLNASDKVRRLVYFYAPYVVSAPVASLLDFPTYWSRLTGSSLDLVSGIIVGAACTGFGASKGYQLVERLDLIGTLQVRWQRVWGVTQSDLDARRASGVTDHDDDDNETHGADS